jgi:hypothetical protein
MKKVVIIFFAFSGAMALLGLSGCKKVLDYVKQHPNGVADNCRITQIAGSWNINGVFVYDSSTFVYNNYGDLVRINRETNDIHRADQGFVYDKHHRIIAFVDDIYPLHTSNSGLLWHTYTYIGNSKIIDSFFVYAGGDYTVSFRPTGYNSIRVFTLTLDGWGRVIKETDVDYGTEIIYNYDANGNLIIPGTSYSNKTNIRQTNKIFALIDRNYSVNQPLGDAAQYNNNDLPVKFNIELKMGDHHYSKAVVTYSCK